MAKEFPDVQFAIIDDSSLKDTNVTSLVFAEEQGSYLVGAIAAQASKGKDIGFIGGVNTPLIEKFEAGFTAGAKAVTPDIKVQVKYLTQSPDFTGFNAPDKGKTTATGMFDAGATWSTTRPVDPVPVSSTPPPRPRSWPSGSTPTSTSPRPPR